MLETLSCRVPETWRCIRWTFQAAPTPTASSSRPSAAVGAVIRTTSRGFIAAASVRVCGRRSGTSRVTLQVSQLLQLLRGGLLQAGPAAQLGQPGQLLPGGACLLERLRRLLAGVVCLQAGVLRLLAGGVDLLAGVLG